MAAASFEDFHFFDRSWTTSSGTQSIQNFIKHSYSCTRLWVAGYTRRNPDQTQEYDWLSKFPSNFRSMQSALAVQSILSVTPVSLDTIIWR